MPGRMAYHAAVIELRDTGIARENNITDVSAHPSGARGQHLNITAWANLYSEDGEIEITMSAQTSHGCWGEFTLTPTLSLSFSQRGLFNLGRPPRRSRAWWQSYDDVFGRGLPLSTVQRHVLLGFIDTQKIVGPSRAEPMSILYSDLRELRLTVGRKPANAVVRD